MASVSPNRLIHATSPYLLQHAHNPVDWYPWGPEALARAQALDRPIFLSIGYSACHWCHVMEHESFENPAVAEVLNAAFVPIKVDREERPDLDDLYMVAVQRLTGRGGWPMSVWLTPDLRPFYGGTYFPLESRYGVPGFLPLLNRIAEVWETRREDVLQDAAQLTEDVQRILDIRPGQGLPDGPLVQKGLEDLRRSFDPRKGGFGGAPKFPSPMTLEYVLRFGSDTDRRMVARTLDAMASGGIYDHLGGGFARYSVDADWRIPHFEKMLYDNAQLASLYLEHFRRTERPLDARVAQETLEYLLRDLRLPEGGFCSAEDADSEGEEGRFYVWTPAEIQAVLGDDADAFCEAYHVQDGGNFEHGRSVLYLDPRTEAHECWRDAREKLREVRGQRPRPLRDDKILVAWNGLALRAFCRGFQVLGERRYLEVAQQGAAFLKDRLWKDGHLLRVCRGDTAHTPAFLEDYAALLGALIDLAESDGGIEHLLWARDLAVRLAEAFEDPEEGGWFTTPTGQGDLMHRAKASHDHAMPSGAALAVEGLLRLGAHLEEPSFIQAAERGLVCLSGRASLAPTSFTALLNAWDSGRPGGPEWVLVGNPAAPGFRGVLRRLHARKPTRGILAWGERHPKVLGKPQPSGDWALHVCDSGTCLPPIVTEEALEDLLAGRNDLLRSC